MLRHARLHFALVLAIMAGASVVRAQVSVPSSASATADFTIRAPRGTGASVAPGAVFTAAFTVGNTTASAARPTPVIELPAAWTAVTGQAAPLVAAHSSDLWLLSVAAPANARAGNYVIHAGVEARGIVMRDSVLVSVAEHRALDVRSAGGPGYVAGGESYDAHFTVRNSGNVDARVKLHATSSHGERCTLAVTELRLVPGASMPITAHVKTASAARSVDDLVEITATDLADENANGEASVQTTIISSGARPSDYWTLPGEISFRAAAASAGVSPVVAFGSGRLSPTGSATVDFSVRARTQTQSVFGERDEYRLAVRSTRGSILLGDQSFGYSQLTSNGSRGTGVELFGTSHKLVGGGYVERNRWSPDAPVEAGATIGTAPANRVSAKLALTDRMHNGTSTRLAATTARARLGAASDMEIELAASDSNGLRGLAHRERITGAFTAFTYDLGGQRGGAAFAGSLHASSDEHLSLSLQQMGPMLLTSTSSVHTTDANVLTGATAQQVFATSVTAGFENGSAIEYDVIKRADAGDAPGAIDGLQQALHLRGHVSAGPLDLMAHVQGGIVTSTNPAAPTSFVSLGGSARTMLGRDQYLSVFGEMTDGRALDGSGTGNVSVGGSTQLRGPLGLTLFANASANAPRNLTNDWTGQADVRVERAVGDVTVALRAHLSQAASRNIPGANGFFLELRRPLRIPTARLDVGGQAHGQVVDAATGKAVAGVMVRLGDQAAISNDQGLVEFQGLQAGQYHASAEGGAATGSLVVGGESIVVSKGTKRPTSFNLSLSQGARVMVRVRRFENAPGQFRTLPDSGTPKADSLIDVGAVSDVSVALIGVRDTTWLSSDDHGRLDFGSVAPGRYSVKVLAGDIPEFHAFQQSEIDVTVQGGDRREVELRMVPKRRSVQIIGGETEVKVVTPKSSKVGGGG